MQMSCTDDPLGLDQIDPLKLAEGADERIRQRVMMQNKHTAPLQSSALGLPVASSFLFVTLSAWLKRETESGFSPILVLDTPEPARSCATSSLDRGIKISAGPLVPGGHEIVPGRHGIDR
jgi:hypothetical protein